VVILVASFAGVPDMAAVNTGQIVGARKKPGFDEVVDSTACLMGVAVSRGNKRPSL
jgi:hypothetical protein